jgi:putative PIN family toxin of toxin-antitoxin system
VAKVRVVLDTNVYISGLLWTGTPHRLIHAAEVGELAPATTPAIMDEVREALGRPKFVMRMNDLNTSVGELMESLLSIVEIVPDTWIERVIEHDPEDDKILACALASRAQWIVSGDEHLLRLKRYRNIPIRTPKAFWDRWSKARR